MNVTDSSTAYVNAPSTITTFNNKAQAQAFINAPSTITTFDNTDQAQVAVNAASTITTLKNDNLAFVNAPAAIGSLIQTTGTTGTTEFTGTSGSSSIQTATVPTGTVLVDFGATVSIANASTVGGLTVNGDVNMPASMIGITETVTNLNVGSNGLLDLGKSFLYVDNTATPFARVQQYINAGYNRDATTGYGDYLGRGGITSSDVKANTDYLGIGYYNGALENPNNPDSLGQIFGPNAASGTGTGISQSQILIRPTLTGDVNGDGVVSSYDVNLINTYGYYNMPDGTTLGYLAGDLNGDGVVDQKDVNIFNSAGNYNNGWYH